MDSNRDQYFLIGGFVLLLAVLAIVVYEVGSNSLPVFAEEAELIYNTYNGSNLDLVIQITDRIEEELPATGRRPDSLEDISVQQNILVGAWISFEAHVSDQPISSVDPLYLDTTFSTIEQANLGYQTMVRSEMGAAPSEALGTYIEEGLGYLDRLVSRLNLVRDSAVQYHEAIR